MPDLTLICQNCQNEFVFSQGEQDFYAQKGLEIPKYCPICRAIKKAETLHPPKPIQSANIPDYDSQYRKTKSSAN